MFPIVSPEDSGARESGIARAAKTYSIALLFPGHMLTDYLSYGDGLVAFGFISALARRGHRLHIIAQRVDIKQSLPDNVKIHTVAAGNAPGFLARAAFIVRSRAIVRRLLRTEAIDLIHQLNPVNNGMSVGMFGLPVPLILGTFVGKWPSDRASTRGLAEKLRQAVRRKTLRFQERIAAAFLVTTPAALSRFSSREAVEDRMHWLPHGIDVATFTPLRPTPGSDARILFLANVAAKKGIFTLLDAFEIVRRTNPDATLAIAGNGPSFEAMKAYIAAMPSVRNIQVLGAIARAGIPQLMADCAVYCLPSFGEPYATTVIEAMACAKPIVVTDSGGIADMVTDLGGRVVETGNPQRLAAALVEILDSPELQQTMGAHNRATAELVYDWPRVTEKLEGIYQWVLHRAAQR